MSINNALMILRMAIDPQCLKRLVEVNRIFRGDPNYGLRRLVDSSLAAIRGEKVIRANGHYLVSSFLPPVDSRAFMSMLLAAPEKENIFTQQAHVKRSGPISCYIAITDRCNYNCAHCSVKGRVSGPEMTTSEWKQAVADLQDMGTSIIGFTGGEPLLREDLEEIVDSVDDRSISYVFTNGYGLTRDRALALRDAGLFGIGISLDSADRSINDEIRGFEGASAAALEAMQNASAAGLHVMAQTVVSRNLLKPENEAELLRLFKLVQSRGAREVRLLEPICSGSLFGCGEADDVFYSVDERRAMRRLQEKVNRRFGYPKVTAFAHTESPEKYGCGAGNQHTYLGPDGQLFPCDFLPLSFGNVRERPISELWQEMTRAIGNPKKECFAMTLHSTLQKRTNGSLPVPESESVAICRDCQSVDYPGFFSTLQR